MKDFPKGEKVRLYDADDYFWDGRVCAVDHDAGTADVDYGDWVQRYPLNRLKACWTVDGTYESVMIPGVHGQTVADYREAA
jgi:hypothetical protein